MTTRLVTWKDGVTPVFNPNATNAGFNPGAHTAYPSSGNLGDFVVNSTSSEVVVYVGGSFKSLATTLGIEITDAGTTVDCENADTVTITWPTTSASSTLTLNNVKADCNVTVHMTKNLAGNKQVTLAGTGLTWRGYDDMDLGTSPQLPDFVGANGDGFTISISADANKICYVALGDKAN
jgi:hypothetical protein